MNTQAEVAQAFEDYQAGRLGTIPAEHSARNRPGGRTDPSRRRPDVKMPLC